ncbi:methyltransferase domain-containing protein [Lelliottia nimipressuralis]|uniref:Class I SAM-dependent methyltransferase n=1 Tax=Lelliottia nimipressuralis TaxID=69220 RepID=A0ABY3NZS4_9ENTR|nr:class I SAM-dependent methyltransferase [Lelliottia nimipressuralis]RXJ10928.1 class I SAM-dependent methyltransferase [Lelliottia nimipressuralis]TYT30892.1 class I SAM-dependent methyltransferase [Lelliottia nimipressuralis]
MSQPNNTLAFQHSAQYWDDRYRLEGNSGAGSYGCLADFKAEVLNRFVEKENISSVMEFGCGDGNQLSLARYPRYTGFDVSAHALERCQSRFANDPTKHFYPVNAWNGQTAELALSLDVIYHLIEDEVFAHYMTTLFSAAERFVIIYASNNEELNALLGGHVKHVRHRKFTDWIVKNMTAEWVLEDWVPNRYPFDVRKQDNTSFADFYIFRRIEEQ